MFYHDPGVRFTPEQRQQMQEYARFFPNQVAEGLFAPHSTLVEVSAFRPEEVAQAMATGDLLPVRRDIQVLCHEMAHWFDYFGTVWGRSYITTICRAHLAMDKREAGFPALVELFDHDRRILAPAYYRFSASPSAPHDARHPWTIQFAGGCEIDPDGRIDERKPIYLVRFGESPSGRIFARQPLSVGALLEVRAVAAEIEAGYAAIDLCSDLDSARTEIRFMNDEFSRLAYDHNLIEYNVAAHVLSFHAETKDIGLTYRLASALAFIALNLQRSDFDRLRVPASFKDFGKRNKAFKRNMNRGFAFACLVNNGECYDESRNYVETCVQASGLGTVAEVLARAVKALAKPFVPAQTTTFTFHFMREAIRSGLICKAFKRQHLHILTLDMLKECRHICPPFMHASGGFFATDPSRIAEYCPEEMHTMALELRTVTRNLLVGCRGFDEARSTF